MKRVRTTLIILLLAALPLSLMAQGPTLELYYMKVAPEQTNTYLAVEKAFKKIHEKAIEEGLYNGWQLWKKRYAADGDPYHYITIHWYTDWKQSFSERPEDFFDEFLEGPDAEILNQVWSARTIVKREIIHQMATAENGKGAAYIIVNRMKVKPGDADEYMKMENEIFKPIQEEAIRRGSMSHWGAWVQYPYDNAHLMYSTVDGFESIDQLTGPRENLMPEVHPDLDPIEVWEKIAAIRTIASVELWELVDFIFPEE